MLNGQPARRAARKEAYHADVHFNSPTVPQRRLEPITNSASAISREFLEGTAAPLLRKEIFTHGACALESARSPPFWRQLSLSSSLRRFIGAAIFIPLTLAIFLAFILSPAVAILQRRGLGRVPSIILIVGSAVVVAGSVGVVIGAQLVHLTKTLPDHEDKIKAKVTTVKHWISSDENSRLSAFVDDVQRLIDGQKEAVTRDGTGPASTVVVDFSPSWFERTRGVLTPAAELLGQAVLTFILVVFMLLRREDLRIG